MQGFVYPLKKSIRSPHSNIIQVRYQYLWKTLEYFYCLEVGAADIQLHSKILQLIENIYPKKQIEVLEIFAIPEVNAIVHCYYKKNNLHRFTTKIEKSLHTAFLVILYHLSFLGEHTEDLYCKSGVLPLHTLGLSISTIDNSVLWSIRKERLDIYKEGILVESCLLEDIDLKDKVYSYCKIDISYTNIQNRFYLSSIDTNPIIEYEDHPDKNGNQLDWGSLSINTWKNSLVDVITILQENFPQWLPEIQLVLKQVIPTGYYTDRHYSASYRETIGTIYMSYHHNLITMFVGLIHEFQHQKINMLSFIDPIMDNKFSSLHYSPLRPDARPLWGLFLGLHAFAPIYAMLCQLNKAEMGRQKLNTMIFNIERKNLEFINILKNNAQWTPTGENIFNEILELL